MARKKPHVRGSLLRTRLRIDQVADLILRGYGEAKIAKYIAKKESEGSSVWFLNGSAPISRRMIRKYIYRAEIVNAKMVESNHKKRVDKHIYQRRFLYTQAVGVRDLKTALNILDSLAKIEQVGNGDPVPVAKPAARLNPDNLTPEEQSQLDRLLAKAEEVVE